MELLLEKIKSFDKEQDQIDSTWALIRNYSNFERGSSQYHVKIDEQEKIMENIKNLEIIEKMIAELQE
jgi:hypothetical protein